MSNPNSPTSQWVEPGRAVATQYQRVFLVQNGVDPLTGGPLLELNTDGPSTHAFTYDEPNDLILVDDDPDDPDFPVLTIVLSSAGSLLFYTA